MDPIHYSMTTGPLAAPRRHQLEWMADQRRMLDQQCAATNLAHQQVSAATHVARYLHAQLTIQRIAVEVVAWANVGGTDPRSSTLMNSLEA